MYDIIIIGSGPAGLAAGIYAARRELKTLIIGKEPGGQIAWASVIENYPGFKEISSFDLIEKMMGQVKSLGVEIKNNEVGEIKKNKKNGFTVRTGKEEHSARAIIVAMGLVPRQLNVPGEQKFLGKGVAYCANCDGPLYKNKVVAVTGGGNAALDAAEVMSKIAQKVYLIHRLDYFQGFESLIKKVKSQKNIEIILNTEVKELLGSDKLEKIKIKNKEKNGTDNLDIDGLFVEIGHIAKTDLVADLVDRDKNNQIIVDNNCQTSASGIFAAGDVTNTEYKQIVVACSQGATAALSAYKYLQGKK